MTSRRRVEIGEWARVRRAGKGRARRLVGKGQTEGNER
jgi:hypothetical protein